MKKLSTAALCLLVLFGMNLTAGGDRHRHTLAETITQPSDLPGVWITVGLDAMNLIRSEFEKRQWMVFSEEDPFNDRVALMYVDENQLVFISQLLHINYGRCGGFMAHASYDAALEASEREVMQDENKLALTYTLDRATEVNTVLSSLNKANIVSTINSLSSYTNRYYTSTTAVNAANWLKSQWETLAAGRSDISVQLVSHSWAMPSVMLTITGAHQPQDIVVIGGHLDSINSGNTAGVAPGADDDASGIATFTEALRAALANNYKPARTLRFIAYAAEEVGLRGSADIATTAVNNGDNVIGVLQLDMTNYKGSTNDIYLMTDYTNASQNTFVQNLIDTYTGATRSTGSCGYACSDHASWHNRGFRATMPFESSLSQSNPNIHTANDTLSVSGNDAVHALKFSKLAVAYMIELAKGGINGSAGADPGPVGGTTTTPTQLQNGESRTNLSGAAGSSDHYYIAVPAGATNLVVRTTGSNGDADIYVRRGSQASTTTYDQKSDTSSSNETVTFATTTAGDYYILLQGYAAFTGLTLTVSYTAAGGNQAPVANFTSTTSGLTANFTNTSTDSDGTINSWSWNFGDSTSSTLQNPSHAYASAGTYSVTLTVTDNGGATNSTTKSVTVTSGSCSPVSWTKSNLSAAKSAWVHNTLVVPTGCTGTLTANSSGGTGDADMYVRQGAQPTTTTYACRPYKSGNAESCTITNATAGTWYISLRAYAAFSGVTLTANWQ